MTKMPARRFTLWFVGILLGVPLSASAGLAVPYACATVFDTTPPAIAMQGEPNVTVAVGTVYTDAGATAVDNIDGDLTARIAVTSNVNTAVPGQYTVIYTVSDSTANAATPVVRKVVAAVVDTTKPVITLLGEPTVTVEVLSTFTDPGATATDNVDGDITARIVKVGTVNTAKLGTYTITYDVADAAGNAAVRAVRTVKVVDTIPPVITVQEPSK
jgi:hypothetical protein